MNGKTTISVYANDADWMKNNIPGQTDADRFQRVKKFYEGTYDKTTARLIWNELKEHLKK